MASEGASWGEEGHGSAEGAHIQHSDEQVDDSVHDSHDSGEAADDGSDDGADYDPESLAVGTISPPPEKTASPALSHPPQSKPKTSGGFLVEASDDDDDDDSTPQPQGQAGQIEQHVEAKSSTVTVNAFPAAVPSISSAMANIDPLAILEARVKEDARGDMDAWLNLIAEYRRRSQMNDVRGTYNRFLEVFPQAVSLFKPNPEIPFPRGASFPDVN